MKSGAGDTGKSGGGVNSVVLLFFVSALVRFGVSAWVWVCAAGCRRAGALFPLAGPLAFGSSSLPRCRRAGAAGRAPCAAGGCAGVWPPCVVSFRPAGVRFGRVGGSRSVPSSCSRVRRRVGGSSACCLLLLSVLGRVFGQRPARRGHPHAPRTTFCRWLRCGAGDRLCVAVCLLWRLCDSPLLSLPPSLAFLSSRPSPFSSCCPSALAALALLPPRPSCPLRASPPAPPLPPSLSFFFLFPLLLFPPSPPPSLSLFSFRS